LRSWWLVVFPFLWLGNDDFLIVPFGGRSKGLLGYDDFLMVTPFYVRTQSITKHPTEPVTYTIHSVFWPFLSFGSDGLPGGRRKVRIAPFYGKTKGREGDESGFVMWPFYTWRRAGETKSFLVFPFYGKLDSPTRTQTTVMFPIYTRERNHLTGGVDTAVFPFWRRARGSLQLDVRRYWPFYEYRRAESSTTEFVAWPFWRRQYIDDANEFGRYTWVIPFYKRVRSVDRRTGIERRKTTIWPIGRWEHDRDGVSEVAIPVLSPIDGKSLREFSESVRPLISIYHRRVQPDGDREMSAAFGLVMSRRTAETRKVSIAGGLVGFERDATGRYLRLLWGIRLRTGKPR
jgi:hypothetical protein